MPDRIRFTLVEDGEDVRSFDFDTETIQIGADPTRGDNLKINLPKGLRHVRARVIRTDEYVEFEVLGGPIWLQGSRLDEGDVAELNIGDILIFGAKSEKGAKLRYEQAKEAEIVLDDVADWSIAGGKKKKRASAEDDMAFEEEVDEYAGLNVWQKYLKWFRKQYAKFAAWRKKAARIKYWIGLATMIVNKVKGFVGIALAMGGGALLTYTQYSAKLAALGDAKKAEESAEVAVGAERDAQAEAREVREQMAQCGCEIQSGAVDLGALAAGDDVLDRFGELDPTLNVERNVFWPDKSSVNYASLLAGPRNAYVKDRTILPKVIDRVCSASADKERMSAAVKEANKYGLHEAYLFVPFVESYWCELAVSFTGPRGMMQFTRSTAELAFKKVDASQANIPPYDFAAHRKWLEDYARGQGIGLNRLLSECKSTTRKDYQKYFYDGQSNPTYPNRVDPRDPRTDWKASTEAAFAWLAYLDGVYKGRGWTGLDTVMLAMAAYNQGEGEVNVWIQKAKAQYKVENESTLTYPEVLGGAVLRGQEVPDAEKKRQVAEGMRYASTIIGAYLATAPKLDEAGCRN